MLFRSVQLWAEQWGDDVADRLCQWFNRSPHIDLRVNPLRASVDRVRQSLAEAGIESHPLTGLPQALRLDSGAGAIVRLPGYTEGQWVVQDGSAQLVSHLLDPQPGETIVDACAAPGGKSSHCAERMDDQGEMWAVDRSEARLERLRGELRKMVEQCAAGRVGECRVIETLADPTHTHGRLADE